MNACHDFARFARASAKGLAGVALLSLAFGWGVCGFGNGLAAQEAAPELFFETVDVHLINVEVFVADKKGNPVKGLTADDFELSVDGDPVRITNFYSATVAAERPEAAGELLPETETAVTFAPKEQQLNLVVFIDNLNMRPQNRNAVFESLRSFLDDPKRQADQLAIMTYNGGLAMRSSGNHKGADLSPLLDELEKEAARGGELDRELQFVLEQISETPEGPSAFGADAANLQAIVSSTLGTVQTYAQTVGQRVQQTLRALEQLSGQMAGLEGRKAILYVSDGLPVRPADAVMGAWMKRFNSVANSAPGGGVSAQMEAAAYDQSRHFEQLSKVANASGVVIHALDAVGPRFSSHVAADGFSSRTQGMVDTQMEQIRTASLQDSFRLMAEGTGGRAMVGRRQGGNPLDGMVADLEIYYSLGFVPQDAAPGKEEKFHRIQVKVRNKDLRVRHRSWFQNKNQAERSAEQTLSAALFRVEDNPLGITFEAGAGVQGAKKDIYEVPIVVKVPLGQLVLVPQPDIHQGKVSLFLTARDEEGRMAPVRRVSFPIRVPNDQLFTALGQYISYTFKLELRGGLQTVAVGVRDEIAAVDASVFKDLLVPGEPGPGQPGPGEPRPGEPRPGEPVL